MKKKILISLLIIVVVAMSFGGYFFFKEAFPVLKQKNLEKQQLKESTKNINEEIEALIPDKSPDDIMIPKDATEEIKIAIQNEKFYWQVLKSFKEKHSNLSGERGTTVVGIEHIYKNEEGAIRNVTLEKYFLALSWVKKLVPHLKTGGMNRTVYQQLLNDYAIYHERQTTMDFHHQLKGAILDAVDDGLIDSDPTRKVIIKGKSPRAKKIKYLNQFQLHTLLVNLDLGSEMNWDWLILLVAKTGIRFSEALGVTPSDFDFAHQTLSINKTWDYKGTGGFQPTKNKSSVRKIQIDWQLVMQFSQLLKGKPENTPIFVVDKVYNSTINDILERHCKKASIPIISIHGLRHTHASLLLFAGVSIASVARRLGHASMTTTQKTYIHIIQELENRDIDLVMRSLSGLS